MKKILVFFVAAFSTVLVFSQTKSAKSLISEAAKKDNATLSLSYLESNLANISSDSEKRAILAFMGSMQEQLGLFTDASKSFVQAASLPGGDVSGFPKRTSDELVLDAVRCSLSCGDYQSADSYLNSKVRQSSNSRTQCFVKLYEQWSSLVKAENDSQVNEIVEILKTYKGLHSMDDVRPQVLLTLWHLTGEKKYSEELKKCFPNSMEACVVAGKVNLSPSPFWYFVPRANASAPETTVVAVKEDKPETKSEPKTETKTETKTAAQKKTKYQQLGLFKDEKNANALCDRLKAKGFEGIIQSEVRPSGTKYFLVVVNENEKGTMGDLLRTAGFECYPGE